jgi:hypothetical protein
MIDTEGRPIEDNVSPSTRSLTSASDSPASSGNNRSQLQNKDDNDLLNFELSIPFKDVWPYMLVRPKKGVKMTFGLRVYSTNVLVKSFLLL